MADIIYEDRMSDADALMWNIEKDPSLRSTIVTVMTFDRALDRDMIAQMEAELDQAGHVAVDQPQGRGGAVTYAVRGRQGAYRSELEALLGDRRKRLDRLISILGDLETKKVEAIATLYAVWNDALLAGRTQTDAAIVAEVLSEWHPEKAHKFKAADLHDWLRWMRKNGLVPLGSGPATSLGRLFP